MEEIIRLRFEWQCPLCGHNNTSYAPLTNSWGNMDTQVIYCDNESGGCDQQVAVAPRAHVTATTYKLVEASHRPDEWGKDTEDEAEARTDYADAMN